MVHGTSKPVLVALGAPETPEGGGDLVELLDCRGPNIYYGCSWGSLMDSEVVILGLIDQV